MTRESYRAQRSAWMSRIRGEMLNLGVEPPRAFQGYKPVPLAIGSGPLLLELAAEGQRTAVRQLLTRYIRNFWYQAQLGKPDAVRHTLDMTPVEPVSDEHRKSAGELMKHLTRRPAQKRKRKALEALTGVTREGGVMGKQVEHRGYTLDYNQSGDFWSVRGLSTDAVKWGALNDVMAGLDAWERQKQRLSGIKVWDVSHSNPAYWSVWDVPFRTRADDRPYTMNTRPQALLFCNGNHNPDDLCRLELADAVPDTEEGRAAIENVRELYETAVKANDAFKQAKRKLPKMPEDVIDGLPER